MIDCLSANEVLTSADLVIVGSGAAGVTLALEFIGSHQKVILLEAGSEEASPGLEVDVDGLPFSGGVQGRGRGLGGTTNYWGGQALPLDSIVTDGRDWVPQGDWMGINLAPWLDRARQVLGLKDQPFGCMPAVPEFDQLVFSCSQWSPRPKIAEGARERLQRADNLLVLTDAPVSEIILDESGRNVQAVRAKGRLIYAKKFVLACGGIDVPRLLLASNDHDVRGVANSSGMVGRCFQDHVSLTFANVIPLDWKRFTNTFNSWFIDGVKHMPKLLLSPQIQRDERLLNVGGHPVFDESCPGAVALKQTVSALRSRRVGEAAKSGVTVARNLGTAVAAAHRLGVQKRSYARPKSSISFEAHCEQTGLAESRITLGSHCGGDGIPRARLAWRVSDEVRLTIRRYAEAVAADLEKAGLARLEMDRARLDDPDTFQASVRDLYHHMGATRMGADSAGSVVNQDLRAHDVANLYVASASVFPSSGWSNPTFTLLQLTLRLADHLKMAA